MEKSSKTWEDQESSVNSQRNGKRTSTGNQTILLLIRVDNLPANEWVPTLIRDFVIILQSAVLRDEAHNFHSNKFYCATLSKQNDKLTKIYLNWESQRRVSLLV